MPPVKWFEVYVSTPENTALVRNNSDNLWNAGYRVDDWTMNANFGYHSASYKNKNTGAWLMYFSFNEPRETIMWKRKYNMYVGF